MATIKKEFYVKPAAKKTHAQLAKAAANVAAYEARNAALAGLRRLAMVCRAKLGFTGSEADVITKAQRFVKNCRSCYNFGGTDLEVVESYCQAVEAAKHPALAKAA